jgi:sugar fermentation stimulation protein A
MAAAGCRAVMLYVVQRADCNAFTIAGDIDPAYAEALAQARRQGVEMLCYTCAIRTTGIRLVKPLRITI